MAVTHRLLLLPGMDGTGELFAAFAAEVSPWASCQIVRYPTHLQLSVEELVERIELDAPAVVIAESFSGAVGIRLAMRRPALVEKLVLVGSFVSPPSGAGLLSLFGAVPFRLSPPRWALRRWLVGEDASEQLVTEVSRTLEQVAPEVLAHRLASISRIDESASLHSLKVPVITISAREDRLVSARDRVVVPGARHFELAGPHLLLQARPRQVADLLRGPALAFPACAAECQT